MANGFWTLGVQFSRLNEGFQHEFQSHLVGQEGWIWLEHYKVIWMKKMHCWIQCCPPLTGLRYPKESSSISWSWPVGCLWAVISLSWPISGRWNQHKRPPLNFPADFAFSRTEHDSTSNIFINETLFYIHYDYMLSVVLPLLGIAEPNAKFAPPSSQNQLHETETTFMRTYLCKVRKRKGLICAIVSIMVTDYGRLHSRRIQSLYLHCRMVSQEKG